MRDNLLLLTYDSCRFDVLDAASTPVLDSYAIVRSAQAPATFTYPSHLAFFAGILPNCRDDLPYYNRFKKQLIGLAEVGETNVAKDSLIKVESDRNLMWGLAERGYQTVGAGAMNWFRQSSLTDGFARFLFTGTNADAQIDFLLEEIDPRAPFFGFINFGETHAPYAFAGKQDRCSVDVRSRRMTWPPEQGDEPTGVASPAFGHQRQAAEFLDRRLPRLLSGLPDRTLVVVCADHGECFGEDGYWGHAVSHPKVWEVPLAVFRLDGQALL